jgi:biofilm PGA synthesis lipoprotein PgaB
MTGAARDRRPAGPRHAGLRRFAVAAGTVATLALASPRAPGAATNDLSGPRTGAGPPLIAILCYHDLSSDPGTTLQTVSPTFLRNQIRACKQAGWKFMSLSELLAARGRPGGLPPRVMVLTFDDGYRSFYQQALPILKAEGVKATVSIITSFVDRPPKDLPPLMSWDQIREVERSGVEIASHSHDLHGYENENPFRDTGPSVSTRRYLLNERRYENREEYRERIRADLLETQRVLRQRLGHPASTLVWPYGQHNEMARGLAKQAGFEVTLGLGWHEARETDFRIGCLPRIMVTRTMRFAGDNLSWLRQPRGALRTAHVSLDDLYDGDEKGFRVRLDSLIVRLRAVGATHVLLDVCADPNRGGHLRQIYAPGHQTETRADLWSMAAAKFANARLHVWARVPSMDLGWAWERHPEWRLGGRVPESADSDSGIRAADAVTRLAARWPTRLSPELPAFRRAAVDFITDLAVYLPIEGVLFDQDAVVLPGERLASDPDADAGARAAAIEQLIDDLRAAVRAWRPDCRFGRVIGPEAVRAGEVSHETSQSLTGSLRDLDLVVVRADAHDPTFARAPAGWVRSIGRRAMQAWRREERERAFAAFRSGIPKSALDMSPPLLLVVSDGSAVSALLPALIAEGQRAGFECFGLDPVTPANQNQLPARLFEAGAGGWAADR